jgi:FixJ family two-component response regulator
VAKGGPLSERAVILAPNGRDAHIAMLVLKEAGISSCTCADLAGLCGGFDRGAGLAIIADEAVRDCDLQALAKRLEQQPTWSDFPVILLTQKGGGPERTPAAARLAEVLGNVTFLERPFHPITLISIVRTAIRARKRQYEARSRLDDLRDSERRLQTALKAGRLGPWIYEFDSETLHSTESCRAHYGRGADESFTIFDFWSAVHPDDAQGVLAR